MQSENHVKKSPDRSQGGYYIKQRFQLRYDSSEVFQGQAE